MLYRVFICSYENKWFPSDQSMYFQSCYDGDLCPHPPNYHQWEAYTLLVLETCPSLACIGFSIVTSSDPSNHCCLSNVLVDRHFQVSHETIDWVEVRPPAGPLKDTQSFSKPLLSCLDCTFRVIVKGESERSAQSEILSGSYQVFKDFAPFRFPSTPTSLPVPAAEEHPPAARCCHHHTPGILLWRWGVVPGSLF